MELDLYRRRRAASLARYKRLRELNAPQIVVRNEQMILWGLRQLYHNGHPGPISTTPEYKANYHKFVEIHTHDNSTH